MKKREKYKLKWAALLLAAALAVGIAPAWAEETDTAELAVSVSGGAFTFDVPFRTTESTSALVLTDGRTGLSTTYLFCSATSQTRGSSIDDIHVCDADGREKDGTIGEITANGTELQLPTYEQTVRIGFTGTASANTEFYTELRVDNVKTQEFTGAAGSESTDGPHGAVHHAGGGAGRRGYTGEQRKPGCL